jgi:hypothetical protein
MVAVSSDGANVILSVDGFQAEGHILGPVSDHTPLYVGSAADGTQRFRGEIDNILLYDRELKAPEIAELYNGGAGRQVLGSGNLLSLTYADSVSPSNACSYVIHRAWTASDGCGHATTGTQLVTIADTTPPTLIVPPNATAVCEVAYAPPGVGGWPTASDGCDTAVQITYTDSSNAWQCGVTFSRVWKAQDDCGNFTLRTQRITRLPGGYDGDGDGIPNFKEPTYGTNPNLRDTDGDGRSDGFEVSRGSNPTLASSRPRIVRADFDGDLVSDLSCYEPKTAKYYINRSSGGGAYTLTFGPAYALPAAADYDGNGKWDPAVFSAGSWYFIIQSNKLQGMTWGTAGMLPVPGDFDGDGLHDPALFDPSSGTWYMMRSRLGTTSVQFGYQGVRPMAADFDGDGIDDLAIYDAAAGLWYFNYTTRADTSIAFGGSKWQPVFGDYNGNGTVDYGLYSKSKGSWILRWEGTEYGFPFGNYYYSPIIGDFNGDGATEPAMYSKSSATFYILFYGSVPVGFTFGPKNSIPIGASP